MTAISQDISTEDDYVRNHHVFTRHQVRKLNKTDKKIADLGYPWLVHLAPSLQGNPEVVMEISAVS